VNHQIRTGAQGRNRQLFINVNGEMTAMGFIHKHRPSLLLQQLDERNQITGIPLVGGVQ
tara:strand:+ start:203 stop:379 length:177 start_codon:yes stop_codon:yes gene_type:complete